MKENNNVLEKDMERASLLVLKAFQKAAYRAFPIYAQYRRRGLLLVEGPRGKSLYQVTILRNVEAKDGEETIALQFPPGYGEVVLAEVKKDTITYPWMVPKAVALNIAMLSNYEADIWSKRIYWFERGEMRLIEGEGEVEVYRHEVWRCYAAYLPGQDIVVGWLNTLVGRADCNVDWILKWRPAISRKTLMDACNTLMKYRYVEQAPS